MCFVNLSVSFCPFVPLSLTNSLLWVISQFLFSFQINVFIIKSHTTTELSLSCCSAGREHRESLSAYKINIFSNTPRDAHYSSQTLHNSWRSSSLVVWAICGRTHRFTHSSLRPALYWKHIGGGNPSSPPFVVGRCLLLGLTNVREGMRIFNKLETLFWFIVVYRWTWFNNCNFSAATDLNKFIH